MEKLLVVERAYGNGSWALYDGRDRIAGGGFGAGLPRAPGWFAEVVAGLSAVGVVPQSLDVLLAGTGPGSFSGIRSVLAALQGLALPRGIPVLGLSSAAALARSVALAHGAETVAVIGDARRGTLWSAVCDVAASGEVAYRGNVENVEAPLRGSLNSVEAPLRGSLNNVSTSSTPSTPSTPSTSSTPSTFSPFTLSTPAELPSAVPQGALVVSPEYSHLAQTLSTLQGVQVVAEDLHPSAEDLAALYFSNPAAAVRDPLPIYLHPAVVTR